MAWTLFKNPLILPPDSRFWLVLPLCLAVAIVYKTVRTKSLRRLPLEIAVTFVLIILGMAALAAGLWAIHKLAT